MRILAVALLCAFALPGCGNGDKGPKPPVNPPKTEFDGESAFNMLKELCRIGPRNHGSVTKDMAEKWIQEKLRDCGAEVTVEPFEHVPNMATGPSKFRNIVARWRPEEKTRVLLATHYDTRSWADKDPNPSKRANPITGANDGGSGTVVLLELARVFRETAPTVGIDMIFFDGEDFGRHGVWDDYFLGSRAWFKAHPDYTVSWGIVVDMVGDGDLKIAKEGSSLDVAPQIVDRVWAAAARVKASAFVDERQATVHDDHTEFVLRKIPVILLIDFEYPYFHTDADEPDKCTAESLGQVGRTILEALKTK